MTRLADPPFKQTLNEILISSAATIVLNELKIARTPENSIANICFSPQYGFTASASREPCGPRFVRISDIKNGLINWQSVPFCKCSKPNNYKLHNGNILIARSGSVGKSFIIKSVPETAVFASYMIRLRVKGDINPDYLYFSLQSQQFWRHILDVRRGSALKNINSKMLASFQFSCPDIVIQNAVVKFFEAFKVYISGTDCSLPDLPPPLSDIPQIMAGIKEQAARIEEARKLRRRAAEEVDAFTGMYLDKEYSLSISRFGGRPLDEVCITITDGDHLTPAFADSGIKFIFVGNVSSGFFHFNGCKYVDPEYYASIKPHRKPHKGDILYSAVGATLGIPAIVNCDEDFCFQRHVALIRPDPKIITVEFLWYMLRSRTLFKNAWSATTGSAQPTVPLRAIRALQIPVPPKDEQYRIVAYLDGLQAKLDTIRSLQRETAAELDALMPSILDRAFRG